ncbi:helix-turn-helix domain-containing protein [Fuchsiella alkaliacetigena]|uniref:helix-turn-helix domain-containing protein n=1 Tax=Fuchsiella alkaliacetigena TaxID=957042 RepID=UPI00200B3894|nr:helix-turn-helix domain-containing protein [Fuchsiella alkaliacetigena]MCK8825495.1 helix-turn-helix domain-containing protein [Fuchsiella alkaliacetigena]
MSSQENKYCITVEEAKERLDVSRRTVYNRLRAGKLDGKKFPAKHGLRWMINKDEFNDQAEVINEVVEVDRSMSKKEFQQAIKEAVATQEREMISQVEDRFFNAVISLYSQFEQNQKELVKQVKKENQQLRKEIKEDNQELLSKIEEREQELAEKVKNFRNQEQQKNDSIFNKLLSILK